jgi:hypothetical protein
MVRWPFEFKFSNNFLNTAETECIISLQTINVFDTLVLGYFVESTAKVAKSMMIGSLLWGRQ